MKNTNVDEIKFTKQLLESLKNDYCFVDDEVKLINAISESNISDHEKITFALLIGNYSLEQLRVQSLQKRLSLSYTGTNLEDYLDKIVRFNPKLGYVSVDAGESGRDEKDDSSCYFTVPVCYNEDIDEYFKSASEIEKKIKKVLRIILIDAKKMKI